MESDLVIWMKYAQNEILKKTWFGDVNGKWVQRHKNCVPLQEEYFEKLCRSPDEWRYSPLTLSKLLRISLHDVTHIAVK